jgi:hypothetical protein
MVKRIRIRFLALEGGPLVPYKLPAAMSRS